MRKSPSKNKRLRSTADFKKVFESPGKVSIQGAKLLYLENNLGISRFGLSVSRRFGNAVQRNRIKRQLREIIRHHQDQVIQGFDFVLIPFNGTYTYGEREKQFLHLISRAKLEEKSNKKGPENCINVSGSGL